MDRNLALEFVRVTEAAAIAAAEWIGRGDKHRADAAAVMEMRSRFNQIAFSGRVVIGEGEKDEAPMLYTGEHVGRGGVSMDLAVDPLEATDSVAYGRYNAIAVIAAGPRGSLLHAPDMYMDKLAVGREAAGKVSLNFPVKRNLSVIAKSKGKKLRDVTVMALDRERHKKLIADIRAAGARLRLITDGDVAGAIAPCLGGDVDALMGIGASTEAVLAAAALRVLGGEIQCRFMPKNENEKKLLKRAGVRNASKIFKTADLAKGKNLTFTATGVIDGPLLSGVRFEGGAVTTHSVVMRVATGTIRHITTQHRTVKK